MLTGDAPQIHHPQSTASIMWTVTLVLTPAAAWGVYVFGSGAIAVLLVSVGASVAAEYAANLVTARRTLRDGSAVLTGLLIGLTMPPDAPLHVPFAAALFAMLVVKWTFGGLGANWMNPALAGRVFVQFSWPQAMRSWVPASTAAPVDGVSAATLLEQVRTGLAGSTGPTGGPMALLERAGYRFSDTDAMVTRWINVHLLGRFSVDLPPGYVDPFLGNIAGSIGEVSALLLLAASVVLFARRIIRAPVPASFFVTFSLCTWVFAGLPHGLGYFTGDVLFNVLTGGVLLAMFFMATDVVTTPITGPGMLIYGAGAGLLTFVLRTYGSHPEGVALAIILMNVAVPAINRATRPRRFGVRREADAQREANARREADAQREAPV